MNNYNFSHNIMQSINEVRNIINEHQKITNNKIVIYSAMTNNYDELPLQFIKDENIDFIFFSDIDIKSNFWNIIRFDFEYREPRRTAKIFKILPHLFFEHYEISLWVDSNMIIKDKSIFYVKQLLNIDYSIALLKHNRRNCIYQEAKECIFWGKDYDEIIENQITKYKNNNYPSNNGLNNGGFLIRKHNQIQNIMEEWWKEVDLFSVRDQLSLNYIIWKNKLHIKHINKTERESLFKILEHKKDINYGVKQNILKKFVQQIIRILVSIKRKVKFE